MRILIFLLLPLLFVGTIHALDLNQISRIKDKANQAANDYFMVNDFQEDLLQDMELEAWDESRYGAITRAIVTGIVELHNIPGSTRKGIKICTVSFDSQKGTLRISSTDCVDYID